MGMCFCFKFSAVRNRSADRKSGLQIARNLAAVFDAVERFSKPIRDEGRFWVFGMRKWSNEVIAQTLKGRIGRGAPFRVRRTSVGPFRQKALQFYGNVLGSHFWLKD